MDAHATNIYEEREIAGARIRTRIDARAEDLLWKLSLAEGDDAMWRIWNYNELSGLGKVLSMACDDKQDPALVGRELIDLVRKWADDIAELEDDGSEVDVTDKGEW